MQRFLAIPATLAASPALADPEGYGYGHMMGGGYGGYGLMFGPVLWLIVLGLIVAGIVVLVRRLDQSQGPGPQARGDALAMLDMRFAKGEIDAKEYAERKKLLLG
jgi:putative membrane protein